MTTLTVTSTAGLTAALQQAHAGDTVLLAPGTYSLDLYQYQTGGKVTIASQYAGNQAVISDLHLVQASGLTFSNVAFASTASNPTTSTNPPSPWVVYDSQNLTFDHVSVHGTLDHNAQNDPNGFRIEGSTNIAITNSEFQQLYNGITELNNTGVTISNNSIHDIRVDGIDNGGSSNVSISGNTLSNFFPVGTILGGGDHSDAIQFWTSNTTADAKNITVSNNTYVRGTGAVAQGIFITDQVGLHYDNLNVTGNKIYGANYNGIMVTDAAGATISNNVVAGYSDIMSWIRLSNDTSLAFNNNISQSLLQDTPSTFTSQLSNQTIGAVPTVVLGGATTANHPSTPVVTVAQISRLGEFAKVSGNALTGDTGSSLALLDVGVGTASQQMVQAGGSAFVGQYGALTVQSNGAYTYTETKQAGLVVGQSYVDHFALTVGGAGGGVAASSIDFIITPSGVGNGGADIITAGTGTQTISNFGAGSTLTSGSGQDTFVFSGLASSTPSNQTVIQALKAGDIIDISKVDPLFHIVSSFDGQPHELVLAHLGTGNWEVMGSTTGYGGSGTGTGGAAPNFEIHLLGLAADFNLTASNFYL